MSGTVSVEPADVHERHCPTLRCQFCFHTFFPMLILPLEKKNSLSNSCIYFQLSYCLICSIALLLYSLITGLESPEKVSCVEIVIIISVISYCNFN